ncbi:MAG: 5'-nucleotidase C-terminal domain-containing protein [Bdellovibrionota bacterium]
MRLSLFLILFFVTSQVFAQKIILLHTNDHHGAFAASAEGDHGLAQQATLVKEIREEARKSGATVILLSAGDINTGPPESNLFQARPDFEAMNMMGFDAMALGNHEFDRPFTVLQEQQRISNFQFLASNIVGADGKPTFTPYIIKEAGGKKIAIIGYTTPDTPKITPTANTEGLRFLDPSDSSRDLVRRLRRENDMVIALSHLGYFPNESHGANAPGDETLARRTPEIDVIVGGHTHTEMPEPVRVGNALIVQANESGRFVGRMDIDLSSGKPLMENYRLIPVKGYAEDRAVKSLLQPYLDEGSKKFSTVVGRATAGFEENRSVIVASERPVGNFVAESQRLAVGADISLARGKSMRAGFPEGDIRLKNLLTLNPLGHVIVTAELHGADVWRFAEAAKKTMMTPGNRPYFGQGFNIEIENDVIKSISLNGTPIPKTPTGKYKVSTTDAIVDMIEEFRFLRDNPTFTNTGIEDVQAMQKYLERSPTLDANSLRHATFEPLTPRGRCMREGINSLLRKNR